MKIIIKLLLVFTGLFIISACAAGMIQVPQKYTLDGQLEQVTAISRYNRIIDWETVDNQSFIIQTGPGNYYLLVLKIPSPELVFRYRIRISTSGSMVRAGLDKVFIYAGGHMKFSYPIERIYKIKGIEQMRTIRDQLIGETDNQQMDHNTSKSDKPGMSINKGTEI